MNTTWPRGATTSPESNANGWNPCCARLGNLCTAADSTPRRVLCNCAHATACCMHAYFLHRKQAQDATRYELLITRVRVMCQSTEGMACLCSSVSDRLNKLRAIRYHRRCWLVRGGYAPFFIYIDQHSWSETMVFSTSNRWRSRTGLPEVVKIRARPRSRCDLHACC